MRPSTFMRRQLAREFAPPRSRSFTTSSQASRPSSQICCACRKRLSTLQHSSQSPPQQQQQQQQRRWHRSSASPTPSSSSPEAPTTPPVPKTHYEFFPLTLPSGPPPSGTFKIDVRALRKEFLQLQSVAHPDRHPPYLKARAEATSARINEAYRTLQNPLLRAQYLLGLRGIDVVADESARVEDQALLMEVLEAREGIEEAAGEEDLRELRTVNEERIGESEDVLEGAFGDDDLERARREAVRLRYWVNIKESLDGWEKGKPVVLVH